MLQQSRFYTTSSNICNISIYQSLLVIQVAVCTENLEVLRLSRRHFSFQLFASQYTLLNCIFFMCVPHVNHAEMSNVITS